MIGMVYFLWLGIFLFVMGFYVTLSNSNIIKVLIGIELMLNASILNFVVFSKSMEGMAVALFVLALAVAETVLALALLLKMRRGHQSMSSQEL
jgi:NADH-quinone oxidoreductase subunit K